LIREEYKQRYLISKYQLNKKKTKTKCSIGLNTKRTKRELLELLPTQVLQSLLVLEFGVSLSSSKVPTPRPPKSSTGVERSLATLWDIFS
jgi:hypothetical protein